VSQIDGLNGLVSAVTKAKPQERYSTTSDTQQTASVSEDKLDLSTDQVVDAIRVQAGLLQNELPGLLAEALLAPTTDSAAQAGPMNSLLFRLVNPLNSILGRLSSGDLPESVVLDLQEEIQSFRGGFSELADSTLISQLGGDLAKSDPLNALLTQLSNPLDDLLNRLGTLG
jgi:hypothetical protein